MKTKKTNASLKQIRSGFYLVEFLINMLVQLSTHYLG